MEDNAKIGLALIAFLLAASLGVYFFTLNGEEDVEAHGTSSSSGGGQIYSYTAPEPHPAKPQAKPEELLSGPRDNSSEADLPPPEEADPATDSHFQENPPVAQDACAEIGLSPPNCQDDNETLTLSNLENDELSLSGISFSPDPPYTETSGSLNRKKLVLSNISETRLTDLTFSGEGGRVVLKEISVADVPRQTELSRAIILKKNLLGVDSKKYPELNRPGHVEFTGIYGLRNTYPLRNGEPCGSYCSNFAYDPNTGIASMDVSGFSNYSIEGINITSAIHLDSSYNFISDITEQVRNQDSSWSEQIPVGDFVRATFEENLSNGNTVDTYARKGGAGSVYFEIYQNGTSSPALGTSGPLTDGGDWQYITLENMTGEADTFDFRMMGDPGGYAEFDYVHDAWCTCTTCATCTAELNKAACNEGVRLTADILNQATVCISSPINFTSKTFDCQGHIIDGTKAANGIDLSARSNNIIMNCRMQQFVRAIYIRGGSTNTLVINNTVSDNTQYAIQFTVANSNTATNNFVYNTTGPGITAADSMYNIIANNTIINATTHGVYIFRSNFTTAINNTAYRNGAYGVTVSGGALYTNVTNNTAHSNAIAGVLVSASNYNNFTNNTAYNNTYGIYVSGSNNNRLFNNSARNNSQGIYLESSPNNYLINNTAYSNKVYGIHLNLSSNNDLTNNTAYNNSDSGVYLLTSSNNTLTSNTAYNSTYYSFGLVSNSSNNTLTSNTAHSSYLDGFDLFFDSNNNTFTNNSAYNNTRSGFHMSTNANQNRFINNTAHSNRQQGFYLFTNSNYNLVANNTLYNNTNYGIYVRTSNYNNFTGNTVRNNSIGIYVRTSNYNNFTGNALHNNTDTGIYIQDSQSSALSGNEIFNNTNQGIYFLYANNTNLIDTHLYNNRRADIFFNNSPDSVLRTVYFTNLTIDSPAGNFTNYTSLDITDTMEALSAYTINWTRNSSSPPSGYSSFAQKFVNISVAYGSPTITRVNFNWLTSELTGYDETKFHLYKWKGSWTDLNSSPDTANNRLTIYNVASFSEFGILEEQGGATPVSACIEISSSGEYAQAANLAGAPIDASEIIFGAAACVKIGAPNVTFNCNGYNITNNGTAGTTYGILLNSSSENVTLKNCPGISEYSAGINIDSSSYNVISNVTVHNNTGGGIYLSAGSDNNNLTGNTARDNGVNGFYLDQLSGTYAYNNTAEGNGGHGFVLNEVISSNNKLIRNAARNNSGDGFYIYHSNNGTLANNTAHLNGESGFHLDTSLRNSLSNNTACNNTLYGFHSIRSNNSNFSINTACNNTIGGFYIANSSDNNNLANNTAYNNGHGFSLQGNINATLTGNTAYNNTDKGFNLESVKNSTMAGSSAYGNDIGIYVRMCSRVLVSGSSAYNNTDDGINLFAYFGSDWPSEYNNVTNSLAYGNGGEGIYLLYSTNSFLTNNSAYDNAGSGIFIDENSNQSALANNTAHGNGAYGIHVFNSEGIQVVSSRFYNNTRDYRATCSAGTIGVNLTTSLFLNPHGTLENYTNLSIIDSLTATESYVINWTASSASPPTEYVSFAQKFANISIQSGAPSINSITWHWMESELTGYDESRFGLWKYNSSGWEMLNDSPDTSNNLLSLYNMNPASEYGILQNNTLPPTNCPIINSQGEYSQPVNYTGTPNSASPFSGSACVIINASNVNFDCNGYNITNNGTMGATYGILVIGPRTNITIRNCPLVSDYSYGIYLNNTNNSNILNITTLNNTDYGIYLSSSSNNTVSGCGQGGNTSIYLNGGSANAISGNLLDGITLYGSTRSLVSGNNFTSRIYLSGGSNYNNFTDNIALETNYTGDRIFIWNSSSLIISGNTILNSEDESGIRLDASSNDTIANNTVYNTYSHGIQAEDVYNSTFRNNTVQNYSTSVGANSGIYARDCVNNTFEYNTVGPADIFGSGAMASFMLVNSQLNTLRHNYAYIQRYGFRVESYSSLNNTLYNNTAANTTYAGFYIADATENNTLENNTALNSTGYGFQLNNFPRYNTLRNNTAYNNNMGFALTESESNRLYANTAHGNNYGIYLQDTVSERIYSMTLYNNSISALRSNNTGYTGISYQADSILFRDAAGSNYNYTNLTINDTSASSEEYSINWSSNSSPLSAIPYQRISFEGKFVNITSLSGAVYIDNVTWNWLDSETPGYDELMFQIWKYSGVFGWSNAGATLNTSANTLRISSLLPASEYGILQFNGSRCPIVNESGTFTMNSSYAGAPNSAPPTLASACVVIAADNVIFDCNGHTITNSDIDNAYGIFINSSVRNTTIRNCPLIFNYTYGVGVYGNIFGKAGGANLTNLSLVDNEYGAYLTEAENVTISNCTATDGERGFYLYTNANNNRLTENWAFNNSWAGFSIYGSSGNNLTGNRAENNSGESAMIHVGIYLESSHNNIIANNSAFNNTGSSLAHGIYLSGGYSNTISGNNASYNGQNGIYVSSSGNNNITGNNASSNVGSGITISNSSNNTVLSNSVFNNTNYGLALVSGSYNNTVTSINSSYNVVVGFLISSSHNNTFTNNTAYNTTLFYGFDVYRSQNNSFISNTADRNGYDGFLVENSSYNAFINNSASHNTNRSAAAGAFKVIYSQHNSFINNTALNSTRFDGEFLVYHSHNITLSGNVLNQSNTSFGRFYIYNSSMTNMADNIFNSTELELSPNSSLTGNSAYGRTYGHSKYGYFISSSPGTTLTGNTGYATAFSIYNSSNSTLLSNNASGTSREGFYIQNSINVTIRNNTATGNLLDGIRLNNTNSSTLSDNNATSNGDYGIYIYFSNQTNLSGNLLHNNTDGAFRAGTGSVAARFYANLTIDNPQGNLTDYTSLYIDDILAANNDYLIKWTGSPAAPPAGRSSFAQKFVDITNLSSGVSIDTITWSWLDSETTGYNESEFELWKYNESGWGMLNSTPDTSANTLSLYNVSSLSEFGIFEGPEKCPVISSPGEYAITSQLDGAPNSASPLSGYACVLITVSNVTFDCGGHSINNDGTPGTTYGILLKGSLTNVTVKNCPVDLYYYGIYLSGSSNNTLINNVAFSNQYGIYVLTSPNNTLINNTAYTNNNDGIYIHTSNNTSLINNTAYTNNNDGISLSYSNNTALFNNTAWGNFQYGISLDYSDSNTLANNSANSNSLYGIYLASSNNNNLANNTANTNGGTGAYAGIYLDFSSGNTLFNNNASGNSFYGINLFSSSGNNITDNTANGNIQNGIYLASSSNNNNLTNNIASFNNQSGILLQATPLNNTLTNNTASFNNQSGIYLQTSSNNTLTDNSAQNNSRYGFYIFSGSHNNTLTGDTASNNTWTGIYIYLSNNTLISNPLVYNNAIYGISINNSNNTTISEAHFHNNGRDFWMQTPAATYRVNLTNAIFDNPYGNMENFTNLSLFDIAAASSAYSINWTAPSATLPSGYSSFAQKFVNISIAAGSASINTISWNWADSELSGYNESKFELWKYKSTGWTMLNNTPDTSNNLLSLTNMNPASDYGILQNNASENCPVISSPGTYVQTTNYTGAPNDASPLTGTACIKINSSNVVFDCNGYSVTNNGTPATTYGILLNGSQVNVSVRNCQVAGYTYGIYLSNSNQSNVTNNTISSTTYNATDSGIYLSSSLGNNVSGNTVYRRGYGYYITAGSNNNAISGNSVDNASNGFYMASNSDNNTFTANIAENSTNAFYESSGCDYSLFSANNASNTSYGFRILGQGNNLSGNYVNRSNYGVFLSSSSGNSLSNNNVSYSQTSFYLSTSNNNNLSGNWAYNGTSYGILFFQSSGCNLTGNHVYHNGQYGILVDQSSNNNFLGGNYAYNNSRDGITVSSSRNNVFSGNFAHMNNWSGLSSLASGTNNTFSGGASYNNRRYGLYVQYANTTFSSITLYNNSNSISIDGASYTILNFSNIILANPYGTLENYTNLSFYDATTSAEDYSINWTANPPALPTERSSFAGKFVNISTVSGTASIDTISWNWDDSELSGYNESKFELWKYNSSGWTMLNDTPDTSNNLLSLTNMNPASDYGILQNNETPANCPLINSPGYYVQAMNYTGAPNDASDVAVDAYACLRINSSDVEFDCGGFSITGDGTLGTTQYGVLVYGPFTNVSVKNCIVSGYSMGIHSYNSENGSFENNTAFNNTQHGFFLGYSHNNTLTANTAYNNSLDGLYLASDFLNLTSNSAYNNTQSGIHLEGSSYADLTNNSAYNNTQYGIYLGSSSSNNLLNNSAYNNTQHGIYLDSSSSNNLLNNSAYNNTQYGIYLLSNSDSNTLANNNASSNLRYGIYLSSSNSNNLTSNIANTNGGTSTYAGIYLASSTGNNLINNTANGNFRRGIYLQSSSGNTLINNTAIGNPLVGIYIASNSNSNNLTNNNASSNTGIGIYLQASTSNNLTNNTASFNNQSGIQLQAVPSASFNNNTLINNTARGNLQHGIYLLGSSNNTLTDNSAQNNSRHGFYMASGAHNNTLTSNTAANNTWTGIAVYLSNNTRISNPLVYNNAQLGISINNSNSTIISGAHLYNNGLDFWMQTSTTPYEVNLTNAIFDNPYGNLENYTNLSLSDIAAASSTYTINWTTNSASLPAQTLSFAQKFINISTIAGTASIDTISWNWDESELSGYDETKFELWKYNSTSEWEMLNDTPDTSANALSLYNMNPASEYGILQKEDLGNCPLISSPGHYAQSENYTGAPNDASDVSSDSYACLRINSSDVEFDCSGFSITGNDSLGTLQFGVLVYGPFTNVSVKNCIVSGYDMGFFPYQLENSSFENNTAHNSSQYGFYLYSSGSNTLTSNTAYDGSQYGFYLYSSNYLNLTDNNAYNNAQHGFYLDSSANNALTSNNAYNNTANGFLLYDSNFNNLTSNSAYNNSDTGIYMDSSTGNNLINNTAYNNSDTGIYLGSSTGNNLINNSAYNNTLYGIILYYSDSNTLASSNAYNNTQHGIYLDNSDSINLISNNAYNNTQHGIYLAGSDYLNLTSNNAYNNSQYGIYLSSSSNNALTSNNAYNNSQYGIYLSSSSNNNLTNNTAYNNGGTGTYAGIYLQSGSGNNLINNSAYNNSRRGIFLGGSNSNTLIGNTVSGHAMNGIHLQSSSNNFLANNTANGNPSTGILLAGSSSNNLTNNNASGNTQNGIFLQSNSNFNNLTDNTAGGNTQYGIYLTISSNNTLTNNSAYSSQYGISMGARSHFNNLTDNSVHNNAYGITLYFANNTRIIGSQVYDNSLYGIHLSSSNSTRISGAHFHNNGLDLWMQTSTAPYGVNLTNAIFDNPAGNLENYTNLSLFDIAEVSSTYYVDWAQPSAPLPAETRSFAQKFVNISTTAGAASIDAIVWNWADSELTGYKEYRFELWKYGTSGWEMLNNTPDTSANTLSLYNMDPASDYGILQNTTLLNCPLIDAPGEYTQNKNYAGASNNATPLTDYSCVKIESSNVTFDCAGFTISNNGTSGTTYGILVDGSSTNITVKNCVISGYDYGFYSYGVSDSAFLNDTAFNNSQYGVYMRNSVANLTDITLYNNGLDIYFERESSQPPTEFEMSSVLFLNPAGTMVNFTNLSATDSLDEGTAYSIDWNALPAPLPANKSSFLGKRVDISEQAGTASIEKITWHWSDEEASGYNESRLGLWRYSTGTWSLLNNTPDTGANTLSLYNLDPGSDYEIITNETNLTVFLNSPGNGALLLSNNVNFNCAAISGKTLQNITLYGDWGGWHANETAALSGNSDSHVFTKTLPDGTYTWNCLAFDANGSSWAPANFTFRINTTFENTTISLGKANATIINTSKYSSNATAGNYSTEGGNVSKVNLNANVSTEKWAGFYGNASADIRLSENNTVQYMYLWIWNSSNGGVMCLSTNGAFSTFGAAGANGTEIDTAWGFSPTDADSGANTYNGTGCSLQFGAANVSGAGYTDTGAAGGFQTCALKAALVPSKNEMLFCVEITENGQIYNGKTGDFELIVPTNESANSYETYYFYMSLD